MSSYSTNYGVYANNVIDYNNKIKAIGNGGANTSGQIVCSSNGKYVLFTTNVYNNNNNFYISNAYGNGYSIVGNISKSIYLTPYSNTMSKDGQYLIIGFDNLIYRLSNYGANYTITTSYGKQYAMASSQSGLVFAAVNGAFTQMFFLFTTTMEKVNKKGLKFSKVVLIHLLFL